MKKLVALISSVVIASQAFAFATKNVNEKLLQNFKENFPQAEQVYWKESPETYTVNFVENGIRSFIVYGKDGNFVSSTRYYQEKNLPYYLLINIRKKYPEKKIFGVVELSTIEAVDYYVKLEDAKVWTTIRMDSEGNLSLVEKLQKAE
ncbi:MAG: hypothetical protein C5B59_16805 [Bacteroidetes bacterium]|nr:MAG: hypothetical protein C5B59_16805 [Bacteroidota bacterium]